MASFEDLSDTQRADLGKAMHKLLSNGEVSDDVKRLLMKADPSIKFPEIKARDSMAAELANRDKRVDELAAKLMEQEAASKLASLRQRAKDQGLDPDAVEKFIAEHHIADYDSAMALMQRLQELAPASPEPPAGPIGLSKDEEKSLWNDPDKWARDMARRTIDEMKGRTSRRSH